MCDFSTDFVTFEASALNDSKALQAYQTHAYQWQRYYNDSTMITRHPRINVEFMYKSSNACQFSIDFSRDSLTSSPFLELKEWSEMDNDTRIGTITIQAFDIDVKLLSLV